MDPEILSPDTESTQFQCRHIFTDGRRCGSPALRGPDGPSDERQPFCYFHHNFRQPIQHPAARKRRRSQFTLPEPEDRSAIQHSIGEVLRRIASNQVDPRRAGLLLYGLQIASLNLKKDPRDEDLAPVSEITHDPEHGLLAPPAQLGHDQPVGSAERLLLELDALDQADRQSRLQSEREADLSQREAELATREAELCERQRQLEDRHQQAELLHPCFSVDLQACRTAGDPLPS